MRRPSSLVFLAASLIGGTSGCMLIPSPYSKQLKPALASYHAFEKGRPRRDFEAAFGAPLDQEVDGAWRWETRFDDINYARLKVWFDAENKAQKIEITDAHGEKSPGLDAASVVSRAK